MSRYIVTGTHSCARCGQFLETPEPGQIAIHNDCPAATNEGWLRCLTDEVRSMTYAIVHLMRRVDELEKRIGGGGAGR